VAFGNAHFGAGIGPIHLDNIGCNGSEENLISCSQNSFSSCYSGHREDAGVRCQSTLVCVEWVPFAGQVQHTVFNTCLL